MSDRLKRGDTLQLYVRIKDSLDADVTGLDSSDFEILLSKNNTDVDSSSATVQEIGNGRYYIAYALANNSGDDGFWALEAIATDYAMGGVETYLVDQYGIPTAAQIAVATRVEIEDNSILASYIQDAAAMAGDYANDRLVFATLASIDALLGSIPTAILDEAGNIDGKTVREALQYIAATTVHQVSKSGSVWTFKGLDGVTDRVQSTVNGAGERTLVELDP